MSSSLSRGLSGGSRCPFLLTKPGLNICPIEIQSTVDHRCLWKSSVLITAPAPKCDRTDPNDLSKFGRWDEHTNRSVINYERLISAGACGRPESLRSRTLMRHFHHLESSRT